MRVRGTHPDPLAAVSAISALAARRRLTKSALADAPAPAESGPLPGSSNPFSLLQPKREPVKPAQRAGSNQGSRLASWLIFTYSRLTCLA